MKKLVVMAIFDRKAEVFHRPMFDLSTASVVRSFAGEVNSGKSESMLAKYPEDFDLYELGEWDDSTGLFVSGSPRLVVSGSSVRTQ